MVVTDKGDERNYCSACVDAFWKVQGSSETDRWTKVYCEGWSRHG